MCFLLFFVKCLQKFKWKYTIFGFPVSQGSAEAQVKWGGKIQYIPIAHFLGNTCAKNYRNRTVYLKTIASQMRDVFLRHGVE